MSLTTTLEGLETLTATLRDAGERLGDSSEVNQQEGNAALQAAPIPVKSGHLKSTATVTATAEGFALSAGAPYAGAVHAREPFFLRALEERRDAIVTAHAQHVADVLTTVQGT